MMSQNETVFTQPFDEPYFQEAVSLHAKAYHAHFGERLLAVYVWGSVHRKEAVRGLSDIDLHAFISDSFHETDRAWYARARDEMDALFPGLAALTRPMSVKLLQLNGDSDLRARAVARALGFRLRYDATLVWGDDLTSDLILPAPDVAFASGGFESVWHLARYGAGMDSENKTDFELPQEPISRLRKLARLAVLGGGYLLMAQNRFRSFKGTDILPILREELPEWNSFLERTQRLYVLPQTASFKELEAYQDSLLPWLDHVKRQIEA